jgi:hypothetical protein
MTAEMKRLALSAHAGDQVIVLLPSRAASWIANFDVKSAIMRPSVSEGEITLTVVLVKISSGEAVT